MTSQFLARISFDGGVTSLRPSHSVEALALVTQHVSPEPEPSVTSPLPSVTSPQDNTATSPDTDNDDVFSQQASGFHLLVTSKLLSFFSLCEIFLPPYRNMISKATFYRILVRPRYNLF